MLRSEKIPSPSVSDKIRVAILRELEILNGGTPSGGGGAVGRTLALASVEYTDAVDHTTTSGLNTVMITCVTGKESIEGIVRPAGVYTFQPNLSNNVDAITVNANLGQIIVDEL